MSKSKTIFIVAGEASGDLHAANMVKALLKLDNTLQISGMGGSKMRDAGVDVLFDASELAVMGIVEVLAKYRKIKRVLNQIKQYLETNRPRLLVLVDYQEFNQRLAAYAKSLGIKVLFYIGPQVWAWRPGRVYKMARIVDHMAVIFPFEVELYQEAGVPVTFTGNPLVDEVIPTMTSTEARSALSLNNQTTVGLFPGSRASEVEKLLPLLLESAKLIRDKKPEVQFVLPLATTINKNQLLEYEPELGALNVRLVENQTYDAIQACDAIIVASGTATLEIGLMGVPMVIVYKISPVSYFILKRLVKLQHVGLVNIVPNQEIVREFIQDAAKAENIYNEIMKILNDDNYNREMRSNLDKLRTLLGNKGGSSNVAKLAYSMMQ